MNTLMKDHSSNGHRPATSFSGLFHDHMSRIFDDTFWGFNGLERKTTVPVNVRTTGKGFELEVVAPGHKKEDFKISVSRNVLTIALEHQEENDQQNKQEGWSRREYRKHSFTRSFSIDDTIDTGNITAAYTNGILHLSMPQKEQAQPVSQTIVVQ